jgi:hypothetical protein
VREIEAPARAADGAVRVALQDEFQAAQAELDARDDAEEGRDDGEDDAAAQARAEDQAVVKRDG